MYLLTGCVVIAPFLIRNYYLSGYLIYPFPAIDLFDVPWKIPQGVALYDAREIAVYDYSNILFTAAFGYLFFAQVPDVWSVLGFVAILVAASRMFRVRA